MRCGCAGGRKEAPAGSERPGCSSAAPASSTTGSRRYRTGFWTAVAGPAPGVDPVPPVASPLEGPQPPPPSAHGPAARGVGAPTLDAALQLAGQTVPAVTEAQIIPAELGVTFTYRLGGPDARLTP